MSYEKLLGEALAADLSDLEGSDCITVYRSNTGLSDVAVAVVTPKLGGFENNDACIKRMFMLLIRKLDAIVDEPFVVIYSHMTPVSPLSQKILLTKYYSILPDSYKKNLKRLFILHHQLNLDVSQFLNLTKLYVKQPISAAGATSKSTFYNKIVLVSSINQLQSLITPAVIPFSYRLHRLDDQICDFVLKTHQSLDMPTLQESFVPFLGTTHALFTCIKYLKDRCAFSRPGIFRTSANDSELTIAKLRLQRCHCVAVSLPALKAEMQSLYPAIDFNFIDQGKMSSASQEVLVSNKIIIGGSPYKNSYHNLLQVESNYDLSTGKVAGVGSQVAAGGISTVYTSDMDVIASVIKFILRSLPEPLITYDAFDEISPLTVRCMGGDLDKNEWLQSVLQVIEKMDDAHYLTFQHLFAFLAEVARNSKENLMGSSNLGISFAPCTLRSRALSQLTRAGQSAPEASESSQEQDEAALLSELAISQFVTKGLIEHFIRLLDLKLLDSNYGEVITTDQIGCLNKGDVVTTYLERDVLWTENIVTKFEKIEASKM